MSKLLKELSKLNYRLSDPNLDEKGVMEIKSKLLSIKRKLLYKNPKRKHNKS